MSTFSDKLQQATNEDKQVNPTYVDAISYGLKRAGGGLDKESVDYDGYTDGIYECFYIDEYKSHRGFLLQLECKQDIDLRNKNERGKVILQVLYYLKYREVKLKKLAPSVVVLGTKINCTTMAVDTVYERYLKGQSYLWEDEKGKSISASTAWQHPLYQPMLHRIEDDAIFDNLHIIDVTDTYCIDQLSHDIIQLAQNLGITRDIDPATLVQAFETFDTKVLLNGDKMSSREKVDSFMQLVLNPNKVIPESITDIMGNTTYSGQIDFNGKILAVDWGQFNGFKSYFNIKNYEITDQKKLTEITDALIEDSDRRFRGDFYTPSAWVSTAHNTIARNYGNDWTDKYIVWDCAWGTGNLTRNLNFSDLICSTLEETDIRIGSRYNPFATKFQYDFLNDDVDEMESVKVYLRRPFRYKAGINIDNLEKYINLKDILELYVTAVDKGIITQEEAQQAYSQAINVIKSTKLYKSAPTIIDELLNDEHEPKKLLFLINPPYATSKNNKTSDDHSKAGVAKNGINDIAVDNELGMASRQLYTLFMYRILRLQQLFGQNIILGVFTQSDFMSTVGYKEFRNIWYKNCKYIEGFMLQGSEFPQVSKDIAISFTLWDVGNTEGTSSIALDIRESCTDDAYSTRSIGVHNIRTDVNLFNKEIRAQIPNEKQLKEFKLMVPVKSALNVRDDSSMKKVPQNCIGGFQCNGNAINYNDQYVALYSTPFHGAANMNITTDVLSDALSLFTARRLISGNHKKWYNWKDEYETPNKSDKNYNQFECDSIVYALFNSKSQQASLRNVEFDGEFYDIINEFFWMSRNEIISLAMGNYSADDINTDVENDCKSFAQSEREIYKRLKQVSLSPDAQAVLDKATELVKSSFKYRKQFNQVHPEYHINTWDAGWYQIKAVLKEYEPEGLKAFTELYTLFEDRMRPLVYELGFLYK